MSEKLNIDEVKQTISQIETFDVSLHEIIERYNNHNATIDLLVKEYIDNELEQILKGIDIEEINRGDLAVRTSLLKQHGITNFLKVYKMQGMNAFNRIVGISRETAVKIKNQVYKDAKILRQGLYPHLDIDKKEKHSNELVKAIYITLKAQEFVEKAQELNAQYHNKIKENTEKAKIINNKLKWFFLNKKHKQEAITAYEELIKIEKNDYLVDAEYVANNIEQVFSVTSAKAWKDFEINSAQYHAILDKHSDIKLDETINKNGLKNDLVESVVSLEPDFTGLKCTLRNYQEFGTKYILHQGYVLLGDEMGLGKTIEAIASMVALRNYGEGKFLVVCPASVLINWCREIKQHSDLQVFKLHGEERDY
ncbi:MAG: DEAD/DEAH box helicase, partial [Clostridia bacterium]|nr:DEAD/DEAH box helicase [Clostridia bacterium]